MATRTPPYTQSPAYIEYAEGVDGEGKRWPRLKKFEIEADTVLIPPGEVFCRMEHDPVYKPGTLCANARKRLPQNLVAHVKSHVARNGSHGRLYLQVSGAHGGASTDLERERLTEYYVALLGWVKLPDGDNSPPPPVPYKMEKQLESEKPPFTPSKRKAAPAPSPSSRLQVIIPFGMVVVPAGKISRIIDEEGNKFIRFDAKDCRQAPELVDDDDEEIEYIEVKKRKITGTTDRGKQNDKDKEEDKAKPSGPIGPDPKTANPPQPPAPNPNGPVSKQAIVKTLASLGPEQRTRVMDNWSQNSPAEAQLAKAALAVVEVGEKAGFKNFPIEKIDDIPDEEVDKQMADVSLQADEGDLDMDDLNVDFDLPKYKSSKRGSHEKGDVNYHAMKMDFKKSKGAKANKEGCYSCNERGRADQCVPRIPDRNCEVWKWYIASALMRLKKEMIKKAWEKKAAQ
ncbi:uncharacterized protein FMAN_14157 [Fusarium mangiferae]|uniref:Uncharacterized protein n=1 Tax=Fusarium mangiferae TaxID=192010 RepID=A0A1L7UJG5_FUSMA|nr:uncharacterized protein FMAN_14157 [Fusarium mangiferae]CVL08205.1 uncharacterized protein FMAN_14157 [Fusarium mangiferae]